MLTYEVVCLECPTCFSKMEPTGWELDDLKEYECPNCGEVVIYSELLNKIIARLYL